MKSSTYILLALCCTGCATTPRAPVEVAHVRLRLVDSSQIIVSKAWLEGTDGHLAVSGYVLRGAGTKDTTGTHLDVAVFDETGVVVQEARGNFEPRQIRPRYRMPDYATYRINLRPLSRETALIQVRAHEGPHPE